MIAGMITSSGWIYNEEVSPTGLRTRMKSELLMNMAMGTAVLHKAQMLAVETPRLKSALADLAPTKYLSAEYYRLVSLRNLSAENYFVTDCDSLVKNCMLPEGFCDFNIADKVDDYMGTKKRVQRDRMVASPLSTLYARELARCGTGACSAEVNAVAVEHAKLLKKGPEAIPAFRIRDIPIDFGAGVTMGEIVAALVLIEQVL